MIWYSKHWVAFLMYVPVSAAALLWTQVPPPPPPPQRGARARCLPSRHFIIEILCVWHIEIAQCWHL